MKLKIFLILIYFTAVFSTISFSQDKDTDPKKDDKSPTVSIREEREKKLAYGLNNEVSELIKEFIADKDLSYSNQLLKVFNTTKSDQIQKDIIELYTVAKSDGLMSNVIPRIENRISENRGVIVASIRYISAIKGVEANEELFLALLGDSQKEYKVEAVKALTASANKKYSQPLMQLYKTDDESAVKLQILLDIGKLEDPATAEFLREIATDKYLERTYRQYAINSLGYLKDEDSFDDLVTIYKEEDPLIRIYAISAIKKYDKEQANAIIFEAIKDENWRIRKEAVSDVGKKKIKDFEPILIYRADKDPVEDIKIAALDSLSEIGGKAAFDYIRTKAMDAKASVKIRRHAFILAINKDTENSLKMIETLFEKESASSNKAFLEGLSSDLCKVEYAGLAPFFEKMLESSSVIIRVAGLRGIRLNKVSSLKDKVKSIAEDPKQASAVKNNALATLETL